MSRNTHGCQPLTISPIYLQCFYMNNISISSIKYCTCFKQNGGEIVIFWCVTLLYFTNVLTKRPSSSKCSCAEGVCLWSRMVWQHSQDSEDLSSVELMVVQLGDEDSGNALEDGRSVHVDSRPDREDEAADPLVHAVVLLYTLHHGRQGRWAEGTKVKVYRVQRSSIILSWGNTQEW